MNERQNSGTTKCIYEMFSLVEGNIADKSILKSKNIDTIVNAANPTLMGSKQGVDGAIHRAVNELLEENHTFAEKICKKLDSPKKKNIIRCRRGDAVITSGYKLCNHVIHVVGAQYDGTSKKAEDCSSSKVQILESCYTNIVKLLKSNSDIKRIAVPIVGSGEYGFPFPLAAKIAVAGLANALIEWKEHDPEMFEMAGIEKIYFFVYHECRTIQTEQMECMLTILRGYEPAIRNDQKVVFQTSTKAHFRYMKEIQKYDEMRGYFSVVKSMRWLLMAFRLLFLPTMWLKDLIGGNDWKKRRRFVEVLALVKMGMPILYWVILINLEGYQYVQIVEIAFSALVIYGMCDTMSYLLTLIVMTDIQRPSANIIRSMLMLFVNYIEISLDKALLYWVNYRNNIGFWDALLFGMLGEPQEIRKMAVPLDYMWEFLDAGIGFFFASLVFGYFANHMRLRKFRN